MKAVSEDGDSLAPYAEQWRLMDTVHERCVLEAVEEQQDRVNKTAKDPERVFGHGLPGSGKTQVMKWLAEYFQEVCCWCPGVNFVFFYAAEFNGFPHQWLHRILLGRSAVVQIQSQGRHAHPDGNQKCPGHQLHGGKDGDMPLAIRG